ncbi:hypothetical protein GE09DRAFT_1218496 [Coniochaeta sp. 2T2.1]|nr:hypothetical protein GE09DRAFT_1218496 [Coniochaeta sp. 2T2.1]
MDHPLYKPLLAASITASSFLVGCQLSLSHVTLATILTKPQPAESTLLRQFKTVFWRGFQLCPSSALFSSLCCFINAALILRRTGRSALSLGGRVPRLVLAGALMIGLIPYTVAFILPVEDPLLEKEAAIRSGKASGEGRDAGETVALLKKWNVRNYIRATIPALGMGVAWSLY